MRLIAENLYKRPDEYPALWRDLKYMIGSHLRRNMAGSPNVTNENLSWFLHEQMGVDDITENIFLADLLREGASDTLDDMRNKLLHYANQSPKDVTVKEMVNFYTTLPQRLQEDARIYGVAGMSDNKGSMGRGL